MTLTWALIAAVAVGGIHDRKRTTHNQPAAMAQRGITHRARSTGGIWTVTAYCPGPCCCGPRACGVTASGAVVSDLWKAGLQGIAADRRMPFGTILNIQGLGRCIVLDRGGAIRGKRIDLLMRTHEEAKRFGVRRLKVEVLNER
jgi:3D (Asp-Asp-Asp) domain-containing protein